MNFFSSLLLLLISATVFSLVNGKREMAIVDEIQAPFFPQRLQSSVIDTQNSAAYFGTGTSPGQVCKYNISFAIFSFVSCIAAPPGTAPFVSAVIDTQNSAAYFATGNLPTQLCTYNVSFANFSFVSCITTPSGANFFSAAVIDTHNSAAYFGSIIPTGGQVCKLNISSTNASFVSCITAPGTNYLGFETAVIDTQNSAAYFGGGGQVCKYHVSPADFSFVSCIAAPPGTASFVSAVIDTQNSAAYFGTQKSRVCKFNISSTYFSFVSCVTAPLDVRDFKTAVIDTQNSAAYFSTNTNPGKVCKFKISPTGFSFVSCISAPTGANYFRSAVIDTQNSAAYFGTVNNPGQVCKYNIAPTNFSLVSCIFSLAPRNLLSSVIDTQKSAVYFGTQTTPSQVCKFNVSSANFSFVSCVRAPSGVIYFASAVIDTQNSAAYFGSSDGQVCKFNISSADFSFVSCITTPSGAYSFHSAVIDTQNSAAYFGTVTSPGQVCKFNISSANFSFVSCITAPSGAHSFYSAVIDTQNSAAYFGTYTNPGQVCKYNISSSNFSFVSCVAAPFGGSFFSLAVIDTQSSAAYFAGNFPSQLCKFSISSADFSAVSCIEAPSGVSGSFSSAVIDAQNSAAYFGTVASPGEVCKFSISSADFSYVSCITAPSGAQDFETAVIDIQNSAAYFGTNTNPGQVVKVDLSAFGCNSDGKLSIVQDDLSHSNVVTFAAVKDCYVTMSSVNVDQPITFSDNIDSSTITFRNVNSTSTDSFVRLTSSTPFASSSTLTFENNQFRGTQLLSSSSDVFLSSSTWSFKCNRWVNGYNNAFKQFATQHDVDQVAFDCPQTNTTSKSLTHNQSESDSASLTVSYSPSESASDNGTVSPSQSATNSVTYSTSLSYSASPSLSATSTESTSYSPSSSQSESFSSSVTVSDTIYCTNLDEITCNNTLPHQCKFCPTTNICVEVDQRCDSCNVLNEQFCAFTKGRCKYCPEHQVCVNATTTPTCDCVSFSSSACAVANSTCNYCSSESVCVPSQQLCGCINFTSTISLNNTNAFCDTSPACHFCPEQQTCLPQSTLCTCHDMNQEQCDVSFLSPQTENSCKYCSNISICAPKKIECACMALPDQTVCDVAGECHWCSKYSTCAPKDTWPDCKCETLNTSDFCSVISNDNCQWCSNASVCADPTFDCECELFNESVCSTSQCKWCDNMNTCTVQENKKCECYYLKTEQKCSTASNDKCSWCPKSDPIGSYSVKGAPGPVSMIKPFQVTSDFNYCVNKTGDKCECSYLSNDFCRFALSLQPSSSSSSSSSFSSSNYSSTCKFCPNLNLCTRADKNTNCDCGQELSPRGCSLTSFCSVNPPVLTVTEDKASAYCARNSSENRACQPVACQGITDRFSCAASGCQYINFTETTGTCGTGDCFNFFVPGFTPQPFVLYFLGLFKDIIVVLLIGAIGDVFTRPIMNVVFKVKKKIKDWNHIERRIKDQTLYMSDRICREGYSFSFSEYVEQICEDVFEFVDEGDNVQVLDEQHRLALFDITAFCLFDNMLWLEPVFDDDENENNKIAPDERERTAAIQNQIHSLNNDDANDKPVFLTEKKDDNADDQMNRAQNRTPNLTATPLPPQRQRGFSMRTPKSVTADTYSPPNNDQVEISAPASAAATITPRNNNDNSSNEAKITAPPTFEVVQLSSKDFGSLATLRSRVEDTLLQRGSSFIYYAQSRNKIVAACAAINSFPTALQLICYIIVVSVLYITSFITVASFRSITQVVSGCNSFTPLDSGVTIGGAFLLLGFRLMNASAEATSVLIFVKTIRGLYQKFTGLHDLTFQQRIPLMGLFADRPIQITLFIYTLMIAPFALAGPFYGPSKDWRCLVPVLIGLGVLIVNWSVLFGMRWYSRNQRILQDQAKHDDHLRQVRAEELLELDEQLRDNTNNNDDHQSPEIPSSAYHNLNEKEEFEEMVTGTHFSDDNSEVSLSTIVSSSTKTSSKLQREKRRQHLLEQSADGVIDEKLAHQITIASAAPVKLGKAILVFLLTEELPVIAISLALQVSFNYLCLLNFRSAFGIGENEGYLVYSKDYNNRRLECLWKHFTADTSHVISLLSSVIPF